MTSDSASPPLRASSRPVLETLPTGRRITGEQAQARSVMVRRLRYILPIIAFVMVIIFLLNTTGSNSSNDAFLEDFKLDSVIAEDASMLNPTFSATDRKNQPYKITANSATQDPDSNNNIVNLNAPSATMLEGERRTLASANKGRYIQDDKVLELSDNVTLERNINGANFVMQSQAATVSIDDETVTSKGMVTGRNNNNRLRADSMQVFNGEQKIVLKGNVLMKFDGSGGNVFKKPPEGQNKTQEDKTPEDIPQEKTP